MLLVAGNHNSRSEQAGFSLLEVMVVLLLVSVALFTVSQTVTLIIVRSINAMELARQEDEGARFVSSITLAAKTATAWGIYSDLNGYTSGPQINLAPQGNVLVCDSATQSGTSNPLRLCLRSSHSDLETVRKQYERGENRFKSCFADGTDRIQSGPRDWFRGTGKWKSETK